MTTKFIDITQTSPQGNSHGSSLEIDDKIPGQLRVIGVLSHCWTLALKTQEDADKLRAWLDAYYPAKRSNQVIQIWDDLSASRPGYYRAYWCDSPTAATGSTVIGYASAGGSHKTVKAAAREALRLHPGEKVYRCGREVRLTEA